jgi:CRISPR system Cascade subunit CasB
MLEEEQLYELYGYVPPNFLAGLSPGDERLYLIVAALFASHPACFSEAELEERHRDLGESLRLFALSKQPAPGQGEAPDDLLAASLKMRMEAILAAPRDEVFGHLRQLISLLKSEEIRVDWAQLLRDLHDWEWPNRPAQWDWSRSFYVGHQAKKGEETHVS